MPGRTIYWPGDRRAEAADLRSRVLVGWTDTAGAQHFNPGTLAADEKGNPVRIRCAEAIPVDTDLRIYERRGVLSARSEVCCPEGACGYSVVLAPVVPERRRERRYPADHDVVGVTVFQPGREPLHLGGHLVDVSRSGVGLMLAEQVFPGSTIEIRSSRLVLFGSVRNARYGEAGQHRVGVVITHVLDPHVGICAVG